MTVPVLTPISLRSTSISRHSEMATPWKPSSFLSRSSTTCSERQAWLTLMDGLVMPQPPTNMASSLPVAMALRNGTRALRESSSSVCVMMGMSRLEPRKSRFPYEGKCLPQVATPASL